MSTTLFPRMTVMQAETIREGRNEQKEDDLFVAALKRAATKGPPKRIPRAAGRP